MYVKGDVKNKMRGLVGSIQMKTPIVTKDDYSIRSFSHFPYVIVLFFGKKSEKVSLYVAFTVSPRMGLCSPQQEDRGQDRSPHIS
ncbi:hypothetical protein C0081_11445 [Cohaesibacter celericrescens]|uniref:Uncharacterized protein n=1 Tax=Cohaesibacter celericrescens TaxID=2067669 RepID=A0A2N5XQ90_9HYPH|nr:hypothetical protein C0081_11445 [Cohaesibacter celericrescens]